MRTPHLDRSRARPGLLIALVAVSLVLMTVWFREGQGGPVHRVRLGIQTVTAPIGAAGEFVTRPLRGFFSWASDLGVSRSELEALRSQNEQLRALNSQLEEAKMEDDRLRALVGLAQAAKVKSLGAQVIGRPVDSWEGVITVDRGSADGVAPFMPVMGPAGLLGETVDVTSHAARVRLITDQSSGVAAMLQQSRATGIVRGSLEGNLTLDFISKETTVRPGDVVVTSGLGGVYPKGLIIGNVTAVHRTPSDLYPRIDVSPSARLGGIEEVLVLIGAPPPTSLGGVE